jgi:UDP-GlcNAc:undecaprenyl-phosphate/decaprenyl-phosphate GlcNAc-1-phosphate transferase
VTWLFSFLVALFVTSVAMVPLMRVAPRLGLIDVPDARKIHASPIPLVGGLAVAAGAAVPVLLWGRADTGLVGSLGAAFFILLVGAIDDAQPLHYAPRLLAQSAAVAVILIGGLQFITLPLFGLDAAPYWATLPVTALFILAATNAVNLADGLDGLAGGLAIPTFLGIGLLASWGDGHTVVIVCAALIGAVLGFLRFNTHPASVFLGDAGSTLLGFTASFLAVALVQQCNTALNPAIVVLLVGVPFLDTAYAVVRRLAAGRSPFRPDKRHLHHQLLAIGLSQVQAVAFLYVVQGLMVLAGILVCYEGDGVVIGAFVLIALAVIVPLSRLSAGREVPSAPAGQSASWSPDGGMERRNQWLRRRTWLPEGSLRAVKVGVGGFVLLGALLPTDIPRDIAVVAACAAGLWLAKMAFFPGLSVPVVRIVIYAAAGFVAYLVVNATSERPILAWIVAIYLMALTGALLVAIRVTRRAMFRVTPQDLLVLFLGIAVASLTQSALNQFNVREIVAVVIVLFYATEFVLAKDTEARVGLDYAALGALCLIGVRGLV